MNKTNVKNILVIRGYRRWLLEAKGLNEKSVVKMERAIHLYQDFTEDEDFNRFNSDRAVNFKSFLKQKKYRGKAMAPNSYRTYLIHLRSFFTWLCTQPGYKSRIKIDSLEYLTVSKKESRLAVQKTIKNFPMLEYIKEIADSVDITTEVGLRNRALISFTFLTGMRDGAIISLPIMSINEDGLYVIQNPMYGVKTKFGKTIYSKIFKFDPDLIRYFLDWLKHLKKKGFSNNDPLFPRSKLKKEGNNLSFQEATEVEPVYWESTASLRKIFKDQCELINKEYYSPHKYRDSAIYYALKSARTGEEIKAVSQNSGHENVAMTMTVYAQLTPEHQLQVLDELDNRTENLSTEEQIMKMLKEIINKQNLH
jgi:integrase